MALSTTRCRDRTPRCWSGAKVYRIPEPARGAGSASGSRRRNRGGCGSALAGWMSGVREADQRRQRGAIRRCRGITCESTIGFECGAASGHLRAAHRFDPETFGRRRRQSPPGERHLMVGPGTGKVNIRLAQEQPSCLRRERCIVAIASVAHGPPASTPRPVAMAHRDEGVRRTLERFPVVRSVRLQADHAEVRLKAGH